MTLPVVCRVDSVRRCFSLIAFVPMALATMHFASLRAVAQESSPEAIARFNEAVNAQNDEAFDFASRLWDTFLEEHDEDPLAAKARHFSGICKMQTDQFAAAVEQFAKVVEDHPDLDAIQDTYLNLGWCQYRIAQQGDEKAYDEAAATFGALIERFPEGSHVDEALFFQGESLYYSGDIEGAVASYTRLVENHEESRLRPDALYALGVSQEERENHAEAGTVYDLFVQDYPEHELATEVRMRKAETVLQADDFAGAEPLFAAVAAVEGFDQADHALFRQAYCAARQDHFAEAGNLYSKVVTEFAESTDRAEATLSAGRNYYRAEDFEKAREWFAKVIEAGNEDKPEAAHWICRIDLVAGQAQQAADLATAVLGDAAGSDFLVPLMMDRADAFFMLEGKKADALAGYLEIVSRHADHPSVPNALYNAAYTAMEMHDYAAGTTHAESFLSKYADHYLKQDVQYVAAECQLHQQNYERAEAIYSEMIATFTDHADRPRWIVRLGLAQFLQKKYVPVIETLSPSLASLSDVDLLAEAHYLIGVSQFHNENYEASQASLVKSLEANATWRQADETLLILSRAYRKLHQLDKARQTAAKLIADFPESGLLAQAHYRLGEYSYTAGDYETAVSQYGEVLSEWPDSVLVVHCHYGIGWALLRQENYAESQKSFSALLEIDPHHALAARSYQARAICRQATGEFEGGIADINAFLETAPEQKDRCDALYVRGLCEVGQQDLAEAVKSFETILQENADYGDTDKVLYELAWAYRSLDNHEAATEQFAKLAENHPDSRFAAEAHFNIGEAHFSDDQYEPAVASYVRAIELAGEGDLGEKASYKQGISLFHLGRYEDAAAVLEKQVVDYPEGSLVSQGLFWQAESLFRSENYEEALALYSRAQEGIGSTPGVEVFLLLHAGQSAAQLEEWEDAIGWLKQLTERFPDSPLVDEATYEQGFATQQSGDNDAAFVLYEPVALRNQGKVGARARFMMGEILFGDRKHAEAIEQFRRVQYGYGTPDATEEVRVWQAKSGFEAGQCAAILAGAAESDAAKERWLTEARKFFQYVVEKHPHSEDAAAATRQLASLRGE